MSAYVPPVLVPTLTLEEEEGTVKPSPSLSRPLGYYQNLEQGSQEWLEARKEFALTASEFGAALGLSKYKTAERLLYMKRNNMTETFSPFAQKFILGWGQNNEVNAVVSFEDHMGLQTRSCGLFPVESSDGQYLFAASPDRLVVEVRNDITVPVAVLECKCPYTKKVYPQILLKDCTIPNDHYTQIQAQLAATQLSEGYYVCWTPYHVVICLVKFDRELWQTYLRPQLERFAKMTSVGCGSDKLPMEVGKESGRNMSVLVMKSQLKHVTLAKQVRAATLSSINSIKTMTTTPTALKRSQSTPPKMDQPMKRMKLTSGASCGKLVGVQCPPSPTTPTSQGLLRVQRLQPTLTSPKLEGTAQGSGLRLCSAPPFLLSTSLPCTS